MYFGLLSTAPHEAQQLRQARASQADDNYLSWFLTFLGGDLQGLQPSFSHREEDQYDSDRAEVTNSEEDDLTFDGVLLKQF